MKKIKNYFDFHKKLQAQLGEDLVYSLAFDNGMYVLAISTHKSNTLQFNHGRKIQTCIIDSNDLNRNINDLIKELVTLYSKILIPKEDPVIPEERQIDEIEGLIRI